MPHAALDSADTTNAPRRVGIDALFAVETPPCCYCGHGEVDTATTDEEGKRWWYHERCNALHLMKTEQILHTEFTKIGMHKDHPLRANIDSLADKSVHRARILSANVAGEATASEKGIRL